MKRGSLKVEVEDDHIVVSSLRTCYHLDKDRQKLLQSVAMATDSEISNASAVNSSNGPTRLRRRGSWVGLLSAAPALCFLAAASCWRGGARFRHWQAKRTWHARSPSGEPPTRARRHAAFRIRQRAVFGVVVKRIPPKNRQIWAHGSH
jgi:hypothetical protein